MGVLPRRGNGSQANSRLINEILMKCCKFVSHLGCVTERSEAGAAEMKLCLVSYHAPSRGCGANALSSWQLRAACCLSKASSSQKRRAKRSVAAEGDYLELKSWLICG